MAYECPYCGQWASCWSPRNFSPQAVTADSIYEQIKHGNDEHRKWLREALMAIFAGKPVPPERPTPP